MGAKTTSNIHTKILGCSVSPVKGQSVSRISDATALWVSLRNRITISQSPNNQGAHGQGQ